MATKTEKNSGRRRTNKDTNAGVNPDQRQRCIAEAAYYKAEKRGFEPGGEHEDWLEAEREFDEQAENG